MRRGRNVVVVVVVVVVAVAAVAPCCAVDASPNTDERGTRMRNRLSLGAVAFVTGACVVIDLLVDVDVVVVVVDAVIALAAA